MSGIDPYNNKPFGMTARFVIGTVAAIMLPPFVVLAVAPMLLVLVPVALVAIPFMLSAFAGQAREVVAPPRRLRALRQIAN
jgi:hypothetical protein